MWLRLKNHSVKQPADLLKVIRITFYHWIIHHSISGICFLSPILSKSNHRKWLTVRFWFLLAPELSGFIPIHSNNHEWADNPAESLTYSSYHDHQIMIYHYNNNNNRHHHHSVLEWNLKIIHCSPHLSVELNPPVALPGKNQQLPSLFKAWCFFSQHPHKLQWFQNCFSFASSSSGEANVSPLQVPPVGL